MHKIKEFRKKKGLSMDSLASLIGVSRQSIYYFEASLREPSIDTLIKIAVALDCTVDDIIDFQSIQKQVHQELFNKIDSKEKEPKN